MRLSLLQRYILGGCLSAQKNIIGRAIFDKFNISKKQKRKDAVDAVTKNLMSLIDKGLLVGLGIRTPKKWYIKEVRLTPAGRKIARQINDRRQRLPLTSCNQSNFK